MNRSATSIIVLVTLSAFFAVGCGSMNLSNRRLQSISVTPAAADARSSPTGQVQFSATGSFSAAPTPVNPLSVSSWLSSAPAIATIDGSGMAQCVPGATGTVTISALASSGPDYTPGMGSASTVVTGTATLTCP